MNVSILITTPKGCDPDLCSLTLDSIRVGFPKAAVRVYWNGLVSNEIRKKMIGTRWHCEQVECHHYDWIQYSLDLHVSSDEPLILLDGDVIFFESVEDWKPSEGYMFAGHYVPAHMNIFSKCMSVERLHSSFIWIQSPKRLCEAINSIYKSRSSHERDYLLMDLISPRISFIRQKAIFHDTMAGLFQAFSGQYFHADMLDKFFHINSAAFYPEVMACLTPIEQRQYEWVHSLAKNPTERGKLRGAWRATDSFYISKRVDPIEYIFG